MTDPFAGVAEALRLAREAWSAAAAARHDVEGMSGAPLVVLNDAVAALGRHVGAVQAQVAAQIARASRPELGNAGLARQQGFRSPAALIAATTGGSAGAAVRLVTVGDATAPRMTLTGQTAPAKHPIVGRAVAAGLLSVDAAAAIVGLLDRVALRLTFDALAEAESSLVEQAKGLALADLHRILQRAEARLDPDGVEPREDELRAQRFLHVRQDRSGSIHFSGACDPETGAPIITAIQAMVGTALRVSSDAERPNVLGAEREDRRSIPQMQIDALAVICRHALGCESAEVPTAGATVVVRLTLEQLQSGAGHATIDGIAQPVSVATARRMAAAGGVIPCVLGAASEILDFGRARRLFSPAQGLALVERDGGCAGCGLPPGMTQVHHIRWWAKDAGATDLDNGILLCVRCHHRVHDDGWEIQIQGTGVEAEVWFVPPRHVDPARVPRLGGRRRFDYRARAA